MKEYHKIQTVFLRDPATNFKTLLKGQWALPEFQYLALNEWVFTEKVDGTNIRVMFNGFADTVTFGGKTDKAQIPIFLLDKLRELFPNNEKFKEVFCDNENHAIDVCLYGEGYGAKIQKGGGNYRKDQSFVLFDVLVGDWWLQRKDVESIAAQFGIEVTPIIAEGDLYQMVDLARKGFFSQWGDFLAEGIVARPAVELKARNGNRVITKLKARDFDHQR
uniref:Putative RNA ligase n=1 Tax=viral metagenome TaxID=1070528 RepID=A0A6M3LR35_9ZZZZ